MLTSNMSMRGVSTRPMRKNLMVVAAQNPRKPGENPQGYYVNESNMAPNRAPLNPAPPVDFQPLIDNFSGNRLQPAKPMDRNFKASGKTVVITGGSQGIGRATALTFAKKGYNVVVCARDATKLKYVADDCAAMVGRAGSALAIPCDVTNEREVRDMANLVISKYENVDVIVNNAGVMTRGAFVDTPALEAKRLMETNYLGAYMVSQCFMPILLKEAHKKKGLDRPSIIMVNGFTGKVPVKYMSAFTASKYALMGLAESMRSELWTEGIHVGQVHPGIVKTNHMERTTFFGRESQEDRKNFRSTVRMLPLSQTPQEVADAIFNCATTKQEDVTVGIPFMAAAEAFRHTGLNLAQLPFIS